MKDSKLNFGSPEFFLFACLTCIFWGYYANWQGSLAIFWGILIALTGGIISIIRWKKLSKIRRLVCILLMLISFMMGISMIPAF